MSLKPLLAFHISAGVVGLLSGAAAMTFRKGSRRHALAGNIFVVSMLCMSGFGAIIGLIQHLEGKQAQLMNLFNGLLTFYLVATGWAAGARREARPGPLVWTALALGLAIGSALITTGIKAMRSQPHATDGYPAAMYFFFGSVALLSTAGDIRMLARAGISGTARIVRHLWRMSFAFLIASTSFFLGQQNVFPAAWRGSGLFYIPALLPLVLMIFWLIRVKFTRSRGKFAERYLPQASPS